MSTELRPPNGAISAPVIIGALNCPKKKALVQIPVPRPDPHLLSHADYYLGGVVGPENLTPTDMLATVGMENGTPPDDVVTRAVVGGTGRFATARGQVVQRRIGRNTTRIRGLDLPGGFEPPSPNYRLAFDLLLWE